MWKGKKFYSYELDQVINWLNELEKEHIISSINFAEVNQAQPQLMFLVRCKVKGDTLKEVKDALF